MKSAAFHGSTMYARGVNTKPYANILIKNSKTKYTVTQRLKTTKGSSRGSLSTPSMFEAELCGLSKANATLAATMMLNVTQSKIFESAIAIIVFRNGLSTVRQYSALSSPAYSLSTVLFQSDPSSSLAPP